MSHDTNLSEPRSPPLAPGLAEEAAALTLRMERTAGGLCLVLSALMVGLTQGPRVFPWLGVNASGIGAELRRSGVPVLVLAVLLLGWVALRATLVVARRRRQAACAPTTAGAAAAAELGRAARVPQAAWMAAVALPASGLAWFAGAAGGAPAATAPAEPGIAYAMAGAVVVVAFLALVTERSLAAVSPRLLPEAPSLRALALLAASVCFVAGVAEAGAGLGLPYTHLAVRGLALLVSAVGIELSARGSARMFLPPPAPDAARAAVASVLARIFASVFVTAAGTEGGMAAPLRQHFGLDFSRSWALAYVRAAATPLLLLLGVLAWGLSGLTLVPLDGRAVYERFGAPVRVLHPGLHAGLPWPFGTTRKLEYGPVHEIGLLAGPGPAGAAAQATGPIGAEDVPPPSVDRLWDRPHPGEAELLIASATLGRQSFQSMSADICVLYRVGLSDAEAMRAAYAMVAPVELVRATAGREIARYFADRTLDQVLGEDRAAMAELLRARTQAALDAAGSGLQVVAVIVEAVHPPAGVADAYDNVRSAQIAAEASVAVERGAAAAIASQSRQYAFGQLANAVANGAASVDAARIVALRFAADREAARAGGRSFLLERYLAALTASLGRVPKTIVDSRLSQPEAPVLDLRPVAGAAGLGTPKDD